MPLNDHGDVFLPWYRGYMYLLAFEVRLLFFSGSVMKFEYL